MVWLLFLALLTTPWNLISAQENPESAYKLSLGSKYYSRFIAYGIDLSGESPAWGLNGSVAHNSGFYAGTYYARPTSTSNDDQQIIFDIGYEKDITDHFSLNAEYSHYLFSSDTMHLFAQYSNSIALNANIDLTLFDLGLAYDRFLGDNGAGYFTVDISTFHEIGPIYLLPVLQIVFMSQTVEERYLSKGKGKNKGNEIVESNTLTGLSNTMVTLVAIYPLMENLYFSVVPSLIFYHQSELSVESTRFVWNAGVRYSIRF